MLSEEEKIKIREEEQYRAEVRSQLTVQGKNRVVAVLLALFFGTLGVHKFYLGSIGWGLTYLIFSWTMIPLIASIVEAIVYLSMSDSDFRSKYN